MTPALSNALTPYRLLSALLTAVTIFWLAACGDVGAPAVDTVVGVPGAQLAQAPKPIVAEKIALVLRSFSNPLFAEMESGARRAEAELGVELLVKAAAQDTSIDQQIRIVANLIDDGVRAIVIAPADSQRLVPVLQRAQQAGIRLVILENPLDADVVAKAGMEPPPFVGVNNEIAAYSAAKHLLEGVRRPVSAAIIEGVRSAESSRMRREGAKRAFEESQGVRLRAVETANWKIDEARDVAWQILAMHPGVDVIFAANDMMALGAVQFLNEVGIDQVKVAGFDALVEAVTQVQAGAMASTVNQQAASQGYIGVKYAHRLLRGEKTPVITHIEATLVTSESLSSRPAEAIAAAPALTPAPVAMTPAAETSAAETSAAETAAAETPAAETPANETSAAEMQATETPAAETPATETPAAETPAAAAPPEAAASQEVRP